MPKVILTEQSRKDELLRKYVRVQMAELGINNKCDVASKVQLHKDTFAKRLKNPDKFTRGEMRKLFKVLRFTPEQIEEVVL